MKKYHWHVSYAFIGYTNSLGFGWCTFTKDSNEILTESDIREIEEISCKRQGVASIAVISYNRLASVKDRNNDH